MDTVDTDKFWFDFSSWHHFSPSVFFSFCWLECLGSIKFWCGSGSWIRTGKKWIRIRIQVILNLMIFLIKNNFQIFCFIFFAYFYSKTWWTIESFRNEKIFIIYFFKSSELGFRSNKVVFFSFWLISYPLDPDPWIRIFLQIRIQEAKINCGS